MRLRFLGTRGEIEESRKEHHYHSSLLLEEKGFRLLVDHGLISRKLEESKPDAVLITHGHPDHFIWLKKDEAYKGKIYLTKETARAARFKKNFSLVKLDKWFRIGPFKVLAYRVVHSLIAPAAGFKIRSGEKGGKTIVYNPDLIVMKRKSVLRKVDIYIGDGSSVKANLVRRKEGKLFGHARMKTQVGWCRKYGIKKIIFTHLGKEALRKGDKRLERELERGLEEKLPGKGYKVKVAYDGMRMRV